jgi:hypothetical protein
LNGKSGKNGLGNEPLIGNLNSSVLRWLEAAVEFDGVLGNFEGKFRRILRWTLGDFWT